MRNDPPHSNSPWLVRCRTRYPPVTERDEYELRKLDRQAWAELVAYWEQAADPNRGEAYKRWATRRSFFQNFYCDNGMVISYPEARPGINGHKIDAYDITMPWWFPGLERYTRILYPEGWQRAITEIRASDPQSQLLEPSPPQSPASQSQSSQSQTYRSRPKPTTGSQSPTWSIPSTPIYTPQSESLQSQTYRCRYSPTNGPQSHSSRSQTWSIPYTPMYTPQPQQLQSQTCSIDPTPTSLPQRQWPQFQTYSTPATPGNISQSMSPQPETYTARNSSADSLSSSGDILDL